MAKEKLPHEIYIAQKDDIPVASKLGYLALRRLYVGVETTPTQVASIFQVAGLVVQGAYQVPLSETSKLPLTEDFYVRAKGIIKTLPQSKATDALDQALASMNQYCGVS